MSEDIFKQIREEYRRVHRNDPQPTNEAERQAQFVFDHYKAGITKLFLKGVAPDIVEAALLYHWLRWATINHGLGEEKFETLTARLDTVLGPLTALLRGLGEGFEDEGPTPEMRELGETVQRARDLYGGSLQRSPSMSYEERYRQTDLTNREIFRLTRECLAKPINPALIESAFLYYWARISTINAAVPEFFFQKLERHWPEVLEGVGRFVKKL
jgi:hypothetical protein